MMTPEQFLSYNLPLLAGLQENDLAAIGLDVTEQRIPASQTLYLQNDMSHNLYFMLSGELAAFQLTAEGREVVFASFTPGTYFGEVEALDGKPRLLAVMAKTDTAMLVMQRASFLAMFDTVPMVRCKVIKQLASHVRSVTLRNIELTTLSVEQRVGAYILRLAAKYPTASDNIIIDPAPTHADIAASIGANREMVSRSIGNLARKGIISAARRRIEIHDREALVELIQ